MTDPAQRIAENVRRVQDRIAAAAVASGRNPSEVMLVAVTKYVDAQSARAVALAGCRHLGESRPQQLSEKAAALADLPVAWHLVGHLQRNKVRQTLAAPHLSVIHSVDSLRLLEALEAAAAERDPPVVDILLEVKVSPDAAKHGLSPEEVPPILERLASLPHVAVQGLMTMSSRAGGPEVARREFAQLRELRDRLVEESWLPQGSLRELSMGMSGDFEEAIAQGATMVRIGSALFEGIEP